MAVAVFDTHQEWGQPHEGLQLFGAAGPVPAAQAERVRALYAARFPRYFDFVLRPGENLDPATRFAELRFYCFRPSRVKILDEHEFGEDVYITADIAPR